MLLALNLLLYLKAKDIGISEGLAVRISLSSAGIWWALFTIVPLMTLRNRVPVRRVAPGENYVLNSFREIGRINSPYGHGNVAIVNGYLLVIDSSDGGG